MHVANIGKYSALFELWAPEQGHCLDMFAYDTETSDIVEDRPELTPQLVIATACDGEKGFFITRENIADFFESHAHAVMICHNATFDLKVTQRRLGTDCDIYNMVDDDRVWCTLVLKRLLSLATEGHTARGSAGLKDCCRDHLGIDIDKEGRDERGRHVRRSFGQFLHKPFSTIPESYRNYAAIDPLVTWHLFWQLNAEIKGVLQQSHNAFGFVDDAWLTKVIRQFGPLTHHVQLRASILTDVLTQNGIAVDNERRDEKVKALAAVRDDCLHRLQTEHGIQVRGAGSQKAMQETLDRFHHEHPDVPMHRTPKGNKWSTAKDDLEELAPEDPSFHDYVQYKAADKLISTYLSKMRQPRLHARFGYLLKTGRTYCGDGFLNLQNLPREDDLLEYDAQAVTVRGCFVPAEGHVFVDADYSQIELVVLAYVLKHQLRLESRLYELIQSGEDVHRLIAAAVLQKEPSNITENERNGAKPVSFGRPGGMGATTLQKIAKKTYGQSLTLEEVHERIQAYHELCPELDQLLTDEIDAGQVLANHLNLLPAEYYDATGDGYGYYDETYYQPAGWLGGMLLKVLRDGTPLTQQGEGREYTELEIQFLWSKAQPLSCGLEPDLAARLQQKQAGEDLWKAVADWSGRRCVFTVTGRLRAHASFCASRNCLFQGPAADGAILAMWELWRASYKQVAAVHDQNVVELPVDNDNEHQQEEVERLMIEGMGIVVPGMIVKVKSVLSRSLNKVDCVISDSQRPEPCDLS